MQTLRMKNDGPQRKRLFVAEAMAVRRLEEVALPMGMP